METMYDRIVKTCKARGITPSAMCVKIGIRKAIISDLKSGKTLTIRTDTVVLFADFLGVTTDYLLTGRELTLTEEESLLLNCWRHARLSDKQNAAFALRDYGMTIPKEEEKLSHVG